MDGDAILPVAKEFTIDLTEPPEHRWDHVIAACASEMSWFAKHLSGILRSQFPTIVAKFRSVGGLSLLGHLKALPKEYRREIQGISQAMKSAGVTEMTFSDLVLFNTAIDYMAKCTSVISTCREGTMLLRNLDWDIPELKRITILVTVCRAGRVLSRGVTFLGCVGFLTVMRPEAFAISFNFRKAAVIQKGPIVHAWQCFFSDNHVAFVLRKVAQTCRHYEGAVAALQGSNLSASGYITLSGVKANQGMVIARGPEGYNQLMVNRLLVQTNHDFTMKKASREWADGDPLLMSTIERKSSVETTLLHERDLRGSSVLAALRRPPVWNKDSIFTCVMNPDKKTMQVYL